MKMTKWICILLAACLFFSPLPANAGANILPSDIFLVIMLKALSYDRNIDRLSEGKIVIGVVYINGDKQAQDFAWKIKDNFANVQSQSQIKNLPTEIKVLSFDKNVSRETFEEQLQQNHLSAVVVASQDPGINKIIFETTRKLAVNSICYSSACVEEGAGLGIFLKYNSPRMVVNLQVVKQEGSDYNARFLALCEVVK